MNPFASPQKCLWKLNVISRRAWKEGEVDGKETQEKIVVVFMSEVQLELLFIYF